MKQKLVFVLTMFFWIPLWLIIALNAVNSFLRTGYFELNQQIEIVKWKWDNPLWLIIGILIWMLLIYYLTYVKKLPMRKLEAVAMGIAGSISLLAILLFRSIAKCDSEFVSNAAIQFLQNNYEAFSQGEYLYRYPFQIGITALLEWIYGIFGIQNYIVFELINMVCIMDIVRVLGRISGELFDDETCRIELVLSMGLLPLFLLSTFIYGDYIGLFFGIHGIQAVVCFLRKHRWTEILKASLWFSAGVAVKNNVNVLVVAAVIALILYAGMNRCWWAAVWGIVLVVIAQAGLEIIKVIYEYRMGQSVPEGIPKIAWITMSMQETIEGGSAAGWYNGYNCSVFLEHGYDQQATKAACMAELQDRFSYFLHHPRYTPFFFFDKFSSQWNEPTFMSIQTNEWYSRNVEPQSGLAISLLYGTGRAILTEMMNIYHFLIMFGTAVGLWVQKKEWRLEKAYFVLNIFGGMLFHMLWEAKARYVLCYFVLMLPVAAAGYRYICAKLHLVVQTYRCKESHE